MVFCRFPVVARRDINGNPQALAPSGQSPKLQAWTDVACNSREAGLIIPSVLSVKINSNAKTCAAVSYHPVSLLPQAGLSPSSLRRWSSASSSFVEIADHCGSGEGTWLVLGLEPDDGCTLAHQPLCRCRYGRQTNYCVAELQLVSWRIEGTRNRQRMRKLNLGGQVDCCMYVVASAPGSTSTSAYTGPYLNPHCKPGARGQLVWPIVPRAVL